MNEAKARLEAVLTAFEDSQISREKADQQKDRHLKDIMTETQEMVTLVRELVLSMTSGTDRTKIKRPPIPPKENDSAVAGHSGTLPPVSRSPSPPPSPTPKKDQSQGMDADFIDQISSPLDEGSNDLFDYRTASYVNMIISEEADSIVLDTPAGTVTFRDLGDNKVDVQFIPVPGGGEDKVLKAFCQGILLEIPSEYWIHSYKTVKAMWSMFMVKGEKIGMEFLSVVVEKVKRACLTHFREHPVFK